MRQRFIAKPDRDKWGVYDTVTASWPGLVPGYGRVKQHLAIESEAITEASRLDAFYRENR